MYSLFSFILSSHGKGVKKDYGTFFFLQIEKFSITGVFSETSKITLRVSIKNVHFSLSPGSKRSAVQKRDKKKTKERMPLSFFELHVVILLV